MKYGNYFMLLTVIILSSCTQNISKEDLAGHWYDKTNAISCEYVLNSDGTGSISNEITSSPSDCSWEYRNDSLIISESERYQVVKMTKREGKTKMITQLHLSDTHILDNGESYTREILWEDAPRFQ